ncbi:hypothetical protein Vadar_006851 [Vaccinium darrowii]|uniref:Uncharacterized protein n=1 Tax=Vaccinium darrowii TaxID=229202 RepID=A0ACB7X888_9ERIC|nr:hypothetical protein Vadar_006851 [Vaccinium darrowii]
MAVASLLPMASMTLGPPPYPTSLSGSGLRRPPSIPPPTLTVSVARPRSKSEVSVSSSLSPPLLTQGLAPPNPSLPPLTGSTRTIATLPANAHPPPPKSLIFAAILLPPGPPVFSSPNPTSLFLRNFSKPATVSFPLLPPKCKLAASYSPNPPPIPARNHTHSQLTGSTAAWSLFLAVICPQIFGCVLLIRDLLGWFPNIQWDNQPMSAIRDLCDPYLSLFRGIIPPLFNSLDVSPILAFLLLGMLGQLARPPRPH